MSNFEVFFFTKTYNNYYTCKHICIYIYIEQTQYIFNGDGEVRNTTIACLGHFVKWPKLNCILVVAQSENERARICRLRLNTYAMRDAFVGILLVRWWWTYTCMWMMVYGDDTAAQLCA